jgi:PilZ domain
MSPPAQTGGNRRVTARWACRLAAFYQVKEHWRPSTAIDVSRLGCRLRLGESLPRGAAVNVRLVCIEKRETEDEPRRVEIPGKVVWSRLEGLSYQCGIRFVREADEIEQLVHPGD